MTDEGRQELGDWSRPGLVTHLVSGRAGTSIRVLMSQEGHPWVLGTVSRVRAGLGVAWGRFTWAAALDMQQGGRAGGTRTWLQVQPVSSFHHLCRPFLSTSGGRSPRPGESLIAGPTQNRRQRWETPGVLTPSPWLSPCGVPACDPVLPGSLWKLRGLPSCSRISGPGDSLSLAPWQGASAPQTSSSAEQGLPSTRDSWG